MWRRVFGVTAAATGGCLAALAFSGDALPTHARQPWDKSSAKPQPRADQLAALRRGGFDVLIIGGATGAGSALDAATRGLRTALVEADDFASGTSSRSTKLIHGGVRYLEKAVFQLDYSQLALVFEALRERQHLLGVAPHLTNTLATLMPCYKRWEVPYFWAGLKAYDVVAGRASLPWSHLVSASGAKTLFPTLAEDRPGGARLKAAVVYYDGQMDDARLNVALATSACMAGAVVANHTRAVALTTTPAGRVVGAVLEDALTGERFSVDARVVVNAAGPFCDAVRRLADPAALPMITPSCGTHLTLPASFAPGATGLIIPKTDDGRVVFLLPWLGRLVAGTTDAPCAVSPAPRPTLAEVDFILATLGGYLGRPPLRGDVLSAWSGIRPLAAHASPQGSTENMTRDHVVAHERGLISVVGGKWTTYRRMAADVVDAALHQLELPPRPCVTRGLRLTGAAGWSPQLCDRLLAEGASDMHVATHLARAYGDRASEVLLIAAQRGLGKRLSPSFPDIEAEVVFSARSEFCQTANDFLARRSRLMFLDTRAAEAAIPRVVQLLGDELGWSMARRRAEVAATAAFLQTFIYPSDAMTSH